jgi:hypothetical protein
VSRDTVQRRRRKLIASGLLPSLDRKGLGTARHHERFVNLNREKAPRRKRQGDSGVQVTLRVGDGPEFEWASETRRFKALPISDQETAMVFHTRMMAIVERELTKKWPEILKALRHWTPDRLE